MAWSDETLILADVAEERAGTGEVAQVLESSSALAEN